MKEDSKHEWSARSTDSSTTGDSDSGGPGFPCRRCSQRYWHPAGRAAQWKRQLTPEPRIEDGAACSRPKVERNHSRGVISTHGNDRPECRRSFRLRGPRSWIRAVGSLDIRVNPEVSVRSRGSCVRAKLWFSAARPTRTTSQVLCHLLGDQGASGGVLLVRERKLLAGMATPPEIDELLAAEADAYVTLWRTLG